NVFGGKADVDGGGGGGVDHHQHRDGARTKVRDGQIELAIPVQIAHRDGERAGAGGEVLFGGKAGRGGARGGGVEQHRRGAGIIVRDGQIESAVRGEVAHRDG